MQVRSKEQEWRGGTSSRDISKVNHDQDVMTSWRDMKKRKECGVTPMVLSSWGKWCHSPREALLEKSQFWRKVRVDRVSRGKKGGKVAVIFGVLFIQTP